MKIVKWVFISAVAIIILVALAGMYKFNYLASKDGYDCDGNKIENPEQDQ